ncbi:MAG TPA: ABC transporter, partial [Sutterella sp.]|nr:ABC transporter [Sutterella sp.]
MTKRRVRTLIFCSVILLAGCAQIPPGAGDNPDDPWEKLNRNTTAFNDTVDAYVMEPVA